MNSKNPLPIRIALAFGGAVVATCLGGYAAVSWYRASQNERDALVHEWIDVFLNGGG